VTSRESPIVRQLQLLATALGCRLFRNTVAVAVLGKHQRVSRDGPVTLKRGDIIVRGGRVVQVGLPTGSADLIGWRPLTIRTEHVGSTIAQFLSVEVKSAEGRVREEQYQWREVTERAGCCAGICRSEDELRALLR
jgi:hypothetical protein